MSLSRPLDPPILGNFRATSPSLHGVFLSTGSRITQLDRNSFDSQSPPELEDLGGEKRFVQKDW
ncbi:MAG: hypothetical protein HC865_14990 [Cyanobacteria bacterium RU_5_0]|nr:hypothetical protein [Cyanobacteria bacterium RU_5_0]